MNNMNRTGTDLLRPYIAPTFTAILFALTFTFFGCGEHTPLDSPVVTNGEGQNGGDGSGNGGTDDGSCDIRAGSNGFEVFCGGESVGYLGGSEPGAKGDDGDYCRVEAVSDGYDIYCGDAAAPVGHLNNGTSGVSCDVEVDEEDGAYFVMKCDGVETTRWAKAWCGDTAYDPEVDVCKNGKIAVSVPEVVIGTQTWMKKNLDDVPDDAGGAATNSWCYGEGTLTNDEVEANCEKYGRLYDWATAMALDAKCNTTLSTSDPDCAIDAPNHQGICPEGFHIPTTADWDELFASVGGNDIAGTKLKSSTDWNSYLSTPVGEGDNGFAALPGGYLLGGNFDNVDNYGFWWSASENSSSTAYAPYMDYGSEGAYGFDNNKTEGFSVRCVKDD